MNKIKESFQHHEKIGRRYKNLSYNDTHDINEAFKESDRELKKLREQNTKMLDMLLELYNMTLIEDSEIYMELSDLITEIKPLKEQ